MRKIQLAISILLFFILTTNCSDKNSSEPIMNKIKFEGITTTDIFGAYTGFYDSFDWRLDDSWQSSEKELFPDYELYNYSCPSDSNNQIVGYPNPILDYMFKLHFDRDSTTRVDFIVVNQNFEEILSLGSVYKQEIAMTFKDVVTEKDSIFRVYYRFVTENNCCYTGHGDIQIK